MLPIKTKPFINESFISWFCRTSFLNGSDPKGLALYIWNKDSQFYKDLDRQLSDELILKLVQYTQLSYDETKNLTLEPLIENINTSLKDTKYQKWYFLLSLGQKGSIRTNGTSFCPKCLNEHIPYMNKYWRIAWLVSCPIHKIKLIPYCLKCNQIFTPYLLSYNTPNIYVCSKCNFDLRKFSSEKIDNNLYKFQNKLLNIFKLSKIIKYNSFTLLSTSCPKDLFLTLNILLAFFYKVLRQPNRFNSLLKNLNLDTNYKFMKINNATFYRLNIEDRILLLKVVSKIFDYKLNDFIQILQNNKITAIIFRQTFKNISPTIEYILMQLSNKKLIRNISKIKRHIIPKTQTEVDKLYLEIQPYIKDEKKLRKLRNKLLISTKRLHENKNSKTVKIRLNKPILIRPKISHQILKERVIFILNNLDDEHLTQKYILDSLIGYFHWIKIDLDSDIYMKQSISEKYISINIDKYTFLLPN